MFVNHAENGVDHFFDCQLQSCALASVLKVSDARASGCLMLHFELVPCWLGGEGF